MVRKIGLFFAYSAFSLLMLLYFVPKTSLYYMGEKELKKYGVVLSGEQLHEQGFGLEVENATLFVKSIKSAHIASLDITTFLFYSNIEVKDVVLAKTLKAFVPVNIDEIQITHSIVTPQKVAFVADGEFGHVNGSLNLLKRVMHLHLTPSKVMLESYRSSLRDLKKSKDGGYDYDTKF